MPPPAPVPTTAKSTVSSSPYCRIGTQPPGRKTSGARPVCGARCGERIIRHGGSSVARPRVAVVRFGRFPGIAPVEIHPHIAARAGRAAQADLVPGGRMGVIGMHDVVGTCACSKKSLGRHAAPGLRLAARLSASRASSASCSLRQQAWKRPPMRRCASSSSAASPRRHASPLCAACRHSGSHRARPVAASRRPGGQRTGGRCRRLRHDAAATAQQRLPFVAGEEPRRRLRSPGGGR